MKELKEKLEALYKELMDRDNEILVLADEEDDPELFEGVASNMINAAASIKAACSFLDYHKEHKVIDKGDALTAEALDDLGEFTTALDMSGDPKFQKQAAVIDQLLLNMGVSKNYNQVQKEAQEAEINRLRQEYREKSLDRPYKFPREEQDRDIKSAEAIKAIEDSIKEYRPMEASLSTRYSPDLPGVSVMRIADNVYQCPITKRIYNYTEGFTTMKGNKVPGTDVQNQTQALGDRNLEEMHFSTRESRLTSTAADENADKILEEVNKYLRQIKPAEGSLTAEVVKAGDRYQVLLNVHDDRFKDEDLQAISSGLNRALDAAFKGTGIKGQVETKLRYLEKTTDEDIKDFLGNTTRNYFRKIKAAPEALDFEVSKDELGNFLIILGINDSRFTEEQVAAIRDGIFTEIESTPQNLGNFGFKVEVLGS